MFLAVGFVSQYITQVGKLKGISALLHMAAYYYVYSLHIVSKRFEYLYLALNPSQLARVDTEFVAK